VTVTFGQCTGRHVILVSGRWFPASPAVFALATSCTRLPVSGLMSPAWYPALRSGSLAGQQAVGRLRAAFPAAEPRRRISQAVPPPGDRAGPPDGCEG
jgi:hypothetical protein